MVVNVLGKRRYRQNEQAVHPVSLWICVAGRSKGPINLGH